MHDQVALVDTVSSPDGMAAKTYTILELTATSLKGAAANEATS